MLDGESVRLEYDQQRLDKYRRTLAYLYLLDGTFVNLEIVRQGYGHAYLNYPFGRMELFRAAEREAREGGRGLWADSPATESIASAALPVKVWVNASSKVYHCPGTRYYGTTARGEHTSEAAAQAKGYRPAYGRPCGPIGTAATTPSSETAVGPTTGAEIVAVPAPVASPQATGNPETRVWVNLSSRVYHCPGTRYYGTTKSGTYMRQQEAQTARHRPASGRSCP